MLRRLPAWIAFFAAPLTSAGLLSAAVVDMGPGDSLAIDQPRATVQLAHPPTTPTDYFPAIDYGFTMILDTGASGYLLAAGAHNDILGGTTLVYPIAGQYLEQGVGGYQPVDVTEGMDANISAFLGASGLFDGGAVPGNVSALIRPNIQAVAAPALDLGSFDGIAGMPAMNDTGVVVALSSMTGSGTVDTGLGSEPLDSFDYIHVGFTDNVAAQLASHAGATIDTFNFTKFHVDPTTGQVGNGPLPTTEDLPVLGGVGAGVGANFTQGNFLFDTGAQLTMISRDMAISLGIDPDDPNHETMTVGGVGGEADVPLVTVDKLTLDTAAGDRLEFHNIAVGIIDIPGLPVDGILGFNLFTTGYFPMILEALGTDVPGVNPGDKGAFLEMVLDFIDETNDGNDDPWQLHLVRNPNYVPVEVAIDDLNDFDSLGLVAMPLSQDMQDLMAVLGFTGSTMGELDTFLADLLGPDYDGLGIDLGFEMGTGLENQALFAWPGFALTQIPEPTTGVLLAAAAGVMAFSRRRHSR
ncbi:MAG: clan AA aspartic protease [Phycisphaeraceae bacterium]|nr:clan AA aspartic protease [Phycisphaeraceae bacterium]